MSEQQDKLDQDNLRCEICNTKQTYYRSKLRALLKKLGFPFKD